MNLQQQLARELSLLGSGGATTITAADPPKTLSCEIVARDSLAISFNDVRVASDSLSGADAKTLERLGNELAAKLTYLMEPICPVEIDADQCIVQLRSSPPQRDDDGRSYFELLVRRGGAISLARYRKENGGPRQPIAATVTREVLLRLVSDFCAVLE
jgi:hypothetical protein